MKFVFDRLKEHNIKLKAKKTLLFKNQVEFLEHIVSSTGVSPNPQKTKVISEAKEPTNLRLMHQLQVMQDL